MIEVNTILKFEDKENSKNKAFFEMNYSTIIKLNMKLKRKKN